MDCRWHRRGCWNTSRSAKRLPAPTGDRMTAHLGALDAKPKFLRCLPGPLPGGPPVVPAREGAPLADLLIALEGPHEPSSVPSMTGSASISAAACGSVNAIDAQMTTT
eukprot:8496622-Pyramimonas_sp.AAC.1